MRIIHIFIIPLLVGSCSFSEIEVERSHKTAGALLGIAMACSELEQVPIIMKALEIIISDEDFDRKYTMEKKYYFESVLKSSISEMILYLSDYEVKNNKPHSICSGVKFSENKEVNYYACIYSGSYVGCLK